ncbi:MULTISPECIES: metal/formaldehyde-sensitive transcriptional repressor [Acinetobacter calcoaceticus/baumannii complex]|uniref:metal/formaldehyde-sensitive transcriptional repressor n=1 Tax=Acinetobacter calcoaceticus/baumannii complex TaxID=909768 RepID=UPI00029E741D|nr:MULTISPECIES: metal/formaldehyde-sensitive transcriptional repressor [Acinetobacter calcoaceticus/baumannii complex]EKU57325.1 metal-sensitive transcriptional repressor [Acinetobacter baumannii WC-348]MCU4593201.1 metal/formaldehyde-sensitive transcriptional repressor [Acinetobacter nosocomialis]
MPYSDVDKKQSLTRIKRVKKQVAILEKTLNEGSNGDELLKQLTAVRGTINGLMAMVLNSYLKEEFPENEALTKSQKKSIEETIAVIKSYLR